MVLKLAQRYGRRQCGNTKKCQHGGTAIIAKNANRRHYSNSVEDQQAAL
jgi:hypothetical protein